MGKRAYILVMRGKRDEEKLVMLLLLIINDNKWIYIILAEEPLHLHIRQKRVINLNKDGSDAGRQIWIEKAPYIVNIQKYNTSECAGTILSAVFVLAPTSCVFPSLMNKFRSYTILSGSASRYSGTPHSIERRIIVEASPTLGDF